MTKFYKSAVAANETVNYSNVVVIFKTDGYASWPGGSEIPYAVAFPLLPNYV